MNKGVNDGFYTDSVSCNVHYTEKYNDYNVNKLSDIKYEEIYCNNCNIYIKSFIDYIKDNIIKKLENLNFVKIHLNIFDKNNILHRLIITVSNMAYDLLKIKKHISFNKSVFTYVTYNKKIVFIGNINFENV
jgi:hypothetical protein